MGLVDPHKPITRKYPAPFPGLCTKKCVSLDANIKCYKKRQVCRGSEIGVVKYILENDSNSGGKTYLQGLNLSTCNSLGVLIQSRDPEQYSFACVTLFYYKFYNFLIY